MIAHTQARLLFLLFAPFIYILLASPVAAEAPAESAIVGMYTQRDVDSQAQLFILDDKTFCFTFTGGALDLIKAGHWRVGADGNIHLNEKRVKQTLYPVIVRNLDRLGPKRVGINFDGYSLSNAVSPVFALSNSDALPTTFRPIFPREVRSWSGTYALPLLPPEQAAYIFIGDLEADELGRPGKKLRVAQYQLDGSDAVRIGFNREQSEPPFELRARLDGDVLYTDRDKFGTRRSMPPDLVSEVRAQCIAPILAGRSAGPSDAPIPKGVRELVPVKIFELEAKRIAGEPLFKDMEKANTTATDDLESLINSERESLQAAYVLAKKDAKQVEAYLALSKALSEKKRAKLYLPLMSEHYAELMVKTNLSRDSNLARTIFYTFVEHIYPAASGMDSSKLAYNSSVVASQGLVLYGVQKDPALAKRVFETLLDKDFDIKTHKNRTLIYNLACYYALTNDKPNMLAAVREVRSRGTPTEQFMKDKDFSAFLQDADFLAAVK